MDDFKINIVTSADTQGAKAAAESLQGLGKSAAETGKNAQTLNADLTSLGSRQNATKDVVEGLDSALKGNAYSFFGLAKSVKNLWEILTVSTPLGRLIQLLLAGGAAIAVFKEKFTDTAKKVEDSSAAFDEARAAVEKLNKAKLDSLQANLEAIKQRATDARTAMELLQDAADKLDDVQMAADLAENKVYPGRTDAEKQQYEINIRRKYFEQKKDRKLDAMAESEAIAKREVDQLAAASSSAAGNLSTARSRVSETESTRTALNLLMKGANEELKAAIRASIGPDDPAVAKAQEAYKAKIKPVQERQEVAFGPEADARLKMLQAQRDARQAEYDAAQKSLLGGLDRYNATRGKNSVEKARMFLEETPTFRKDYAERFGEVADIRTDSGPERFKDWNVIRDARSMRETNPVDLAQVTRTGENTGKQISDAMNEAVRKNNEAILQGWRDDNARRDAEIARIRSQLQAGPRGGN